MNIVFLKYISSERKYIFRLNNEQSERINFLEIRVYFNRKFMTCTLKSVHDQSLFEKNLPFHSDGFFNRHNFLFNSNPVDSWFPESVSYRFDHAVESLTASLQLMSRDLTRQGRSFFFKMIKNEKYKDLIEHISEVWIFQKNDYLRDYSLEDKKYYFAFNLLYHYINQGRKKVIRNTLYR